MHKVSNQGTRATRHEANGSRGGRFTVAGTKPVDSLFPGVRLTLWAIALGVILTACSASASDFVIVVDVSWLSALMYHPSSTSSVDSLGNFPAISRR